MTWKVCKCGQNPLYLQNQRILSQNTNHSNTKLMRERYFLCALAAVAALSLSAQEVVPTIKRNLPMRSLPAGKAMPATLGVDKAIGTDVMRKMSVPALASDTSATVANWNYLHRKNYHWADSCWVMDEESTYTRDDYGRELSVVTSNGFTRISKYDEKGRRCEEYTAQDETLFTKSFLFYDTVEEDFGTGFMSYSRRNEKEEWNFERGYQWEIQRDERGNVKDTYYVEKTSSDSLVDHFLSLHYDSVTWQPTTILVGVENGTVFTNLKWHKFNGQILQPLNYDQSLIPYNFLYTQDRFNQPTDGEFSGQTFHIDYDEHGFTKAVYVTDTLGGNALMMNVYVRKVEDDLSERHDLRFYYDFDGDGGIDEEKELYRIMCKQVRPDGQVVLQELMDGSGYFVNSLSYDEYGNLISYSYMEEQDGNFVLKKGYEDSYVYDNSNGTVLECERSVYDAEKSVFVPQSKVVYSDYVRYASTGISEAGDAADAQSGPTRVYDLQGRCVGATVKGLPAGVYVVKQGKTTSKVIVR